MERLNGVSSERVKAQTGRGWAEWIEYLDGVEAIERDHAGIVGLVGAEVPRPWWAQMVAVGYEQAKGRRVRNQTSEGFQVSVSRTLDQPAAKLYKAWHEFLGEWYDGPEYEVTTNNMNKNIRAKFGDGSAFEVRFFETQTGKTQLTVDHNKLTTATGAEAARSLWKKQMDQLQAFVR